MNSKNKLNAYKNYLPVLVTLILAGLAMLFGVDQTSAAQVTRANPQFKPTPPPLIRRTQPAQKPVIFKGTGTNLQSPKLEISRQIRTPVALTLPEKQISFNEALISSGAAQGIIGSLPYAVLGPRTVYVADRAALELVNAAVRPKGNYILFRDFEHETWFDLYIKPTAAGQWFMIDCSVSLEENTPGITFKIYGSGGTAEQRVNGPDHIQAFVVAQNNTWHMVTVGAPRGSRWLLHSCEITKKD